MSEQYFSQSPQSKSDPKIWTFPLRGMQYTFTSDAGVFSKKEVDFGSRTLIESFEEPKVNGEILDLGCGYGPIGITLAKTFPERHIVLSDINERAVSLAKKNAQKNSVENVEFIISDRLESFRERTFAAILVNPPIRAGKQIIYQMFEESFQALEPNGELWVVIQKKQGAPSAQKKLEELFSTVNIETKNKGYYIIRAKKE
ncbi:class I SAM-dependent methyltransferase [Aquibacillus kalidii]|uniref:class I SAM-dependent methyltransferase n=1 Tax=Aquibacillus kalidii TaxID=2762597 RepID=UPI001644FA9A|nr:class I SAM-dependent methyltransferase [Aquibacillus kalidii]